MGELEREREARTETRPVYKWARSVSLCVEIKSKRGAWLGLGRGRANFLRFLANRFSPGVSGCSVCAPPRWDIPAFSCRLIRYTPPISARKLRDCSFGMLSFSFFFMARVVFFFCCSRFGEFVQGNVLYDKKINFSCNYLLKGCKGSLRFKI